MTNYVLYFFLIVPETMLSFPQLGGEHNETKMNFFKDQCLGISNLKRLFKEQESVRLYDWDEKLRQKWEIFLHHLKQLQKGILNSNCSLKTYLKTKEFKEYNVKKLKNIEYGNISVSKFGGTTNCVHVNRGILTVGLIWP